MNISENRLYTISMRYACFVSWKIYSEYHEPHSYKFEMKQIPNIYTIRRLWAAHKKNGKNNVKAISNSKCLNKIVLLRKSVYMANSSHINLTIQTRGTVYLILFKKHHSLQNIFDIIIKARQRLFMCTVNPYRLTKIFEKN